MAILGDDIVHELGGEQSEHKAFITSYPSPHRGYMWSDCHLQKVLIVLENFRIFEVGSVANSAGPYHD